MPPNRRQWRSLFRICPWAGVKLSMWLGEPKSSAWPSKRMYVYKQTSMWVHTPLELKILPDFGLKFFGLNSCGWTRQLKELFTAPKAPGKKSISLFTLFIRPLTAFSYIFYTFLCLSSHWRILIFGAPKDEDRKLFGKGTGNLSHRTSRCPCCSWLIGGSRNKSPCQSQVNSQV